MIFFNVCSNTKLQLEPFKHLSILELREVAQRENPNIPYTLLPLRPPWPRYCNNSRLCKCAKNEQLVKVIISFFTIQVPNTTLTELPSLLNLKINNEYFQAFSHGPDHTYYLYSAIPDERIVMNEIFICQQYFLCRFLLSSDASQIFKGVYLILSRKGSQQSEYHSV